MSNSRTNLDVHLTRMNVFIRRTSKLVRELLRENPFRSRGRFNFYEINKRRKVRFYHCRRVEPSRQTFEVEPSRVFSSRRKYRRADQLVLSSLSLHIFYTNEINKFFETSKVFGK